MEIDIHVEELQHCTASMLCPLKSTRYLPDCAVRSEYILTNCSVQLLLLLGEKLQITQTEKSIMVYILVCIPFSKLKLITLFTRASRTVLQFGWLKTCQNTGKRIVPVFNPNFLSNPILPCGLLARTCLYTTGIDRIFVYLPGLDLYQSTSKQAKKRKRLWCYVYEQA